MSSAVAPWTGIKEPVKAGSQHSHSVIILQPFRHFTYVTTHSSTLPSLYLRHSSFSNPSDASTTSQIILQPFFRFSYITAIEEGGDTVSRGVKGNA